MLPREEMSRRAPLLGLALVLMLASFVLFGLGHGVLAMTLFIGAFLAVAAAKRA
jgi:hypothetical protein